MHNKTKTNTELQQTMGSTPKIYQQQQNHHLRTDRSLSHRGGGGLKCILLAANFALDLNSLHRHNARIQKIPPGGSDNVFMCHQRFYRGPYGPPSRTNCFSRGFVPDFLRKYIVACDFPRGAVRNPSPPLSGSAISTEACYYTENLS